MLRGRTVAVGVSGGIAAYKACELVRWLRGRGAAVIVVMTPAATEFVTPLTFQALSGNPVVRDLWGDQAPAFDVPPKAKKHMSGSVEHIDVAEAADAIVVAPATADLIARVVHGEAPDALTATLLASRSPIIVCPAMDREMWRSAATRANMERLRSRGVFVVDPESGPLASGLMGPGRLAPIDRIAEIVELAIVRHTSMKGLRVLVGAGRTEEPLDPVRVLTNRSSGKMGFALASAARDRGAHVTLVSGPASVDPPPEIERVSVATAVEMERAMRKAASKADIVLMAAAVADYRPQHPKRAKIRRGAATMTLELEPCPDILAAMAKRRQPGQVFVGFALETGSGVARARTKLRNKGVDLIVLNAPGDALGLDTNRVTLVEARVAKRLPVQTKREVAEHILDRTLELRSRTPNRRTEKRRIASRKR